MFSFCRFPFQSHDDHNREHLEVCDFLREHWTFRHLLVNIWIMMVLKMQVLIFSLIMIVSYSYFEKEQLKIIAFISVLHFQLSRLFNILLLP